MYKSLNIKELFGCIASRTSRSILTTSGALYLPNQLFNNEPPISNSRSNSAKSKQYHKRNHIFDGKYNRGLPHQFMAGKNLLMEHSSSFTGRRLVPYPKCVIKEMLEVDELIDNIIEDAPPYITFHYTLEGEKEECALEYAKHKLSRIILGFPNKSTDEMICITLDLKSLLQD